MGNTTSGRRRVKVDEQYTRPQGLYPDRERDVDAKKLRRLILDGKLAACYPGVEEAHADLEECPICFLHYPSLNRSRCCAKGICTGPSSIPEESVHDGQLVEYVDKVDPELVKEKKGEDTSVERAMAVAILMGSCKGACIYPTREDPVYWRAVYDGMAPEDSDGEENDPHEYFRKVDYEYLGSEHLKGVSSKRSELAGMRGVRQVFETCTKFNWKKARTEEQLEEQKALKEKLMNGKWHTDENGVPFSLDTFVAICHTVWREPECRLTAEQLVWTCQIVDLQLRDVPFEGNDTKNANNMQEMADVVGDLLEDAAKKKLKMKFKMREVMEEINVAQLTRAYVADGMSALRPDGTEKSKKRSRKTGRHINTAAWSKIRKLASGEASGEESGEKDNTADPIATSS